MMRPYTKHFQQKAVVFSRYDDLKKAVFTILAGAVYFAAVMALCGGKL